MIKLKMQVGRYWLINNDTSDYWALKFKHPVTLECVGRWVNEWDKSYHIVGKIKSKEGNIRHAGISVIDAVFNSEYEIPY